jgi:hypothetical protein
MENSAENLPVGQTENIPDKNVDPFSKVVEESEARLQSENQTSGTHAAAAAPSKRGPGRPRKSQTQPTSVSSAAPPAGGSQTEVILPPLDVSKELIVPIQSISKLPATRYGIPELAFTEAEAGACAVACSNVLNAFFPDLSKISPKTAAVVVACTTVGTIGFQKYQIFVAHRDAAIAEANRQAQVNEEVRHPRPSGVAATDHYRRPNA